MPADPREHPEPYTFNGGHGEATCNVPNELAARFLGNAASAFEPEEGWAEFVADNANNGRHCLMGLIDAENNFTAEDSVNCRGSCALEDLLNEGKRLGAIAMVTQRAAKKQPSAAPEQ